MYVHPATGILCRVPERRAPWHHKAKKPSDIVKSGDREMRRINGIWYWVETVQEMAPLHNTAGEIIGNVTQNMLVKRQACGRDLRRHGVANSPSFSS